jgi:ubiquinone/menaquinone biosynthesis C-methylase UbiE
MKVKSNLNHWYDGWFYDKFIAPNQRQYFLDALRMIDKDSTVLDIACGTGDFSILAASKAKYVVGIDLSVRNIKSAKAKLKIKDMNNIEFLHGNALMLSNMFDRRFDYSFISFALHEMPNEIREKVFQEMIAVSEKIIIADFAVDMAFNLTGMISRAAEFFAGYDHFTNFLDFRKNGAVHGLLQKNDLIIIKNKKKARNTSELILAGRKSV